MKTDIMPEIISAHIRDFDIIEIKEAHTSGDMVYQIGDKYILKISDNKERLKREKDVNDFLKNRLPVSQTICYMEENNKAYYLKTCLQGDTLVNKEYLSKPEKLAKLLAEAINMVHSVNVEDCTIKSPDSEGECFVHGDFCLPNILVQNDKISGFIDTEAGGIGDAWLDYAWCIWSFEHNLGTNEYTNILLEELGIKFEQEKFTYYTKITI